MKRSADIPRPAPPVVGFADSYTGGFVDGFHTHDRGQLSLLLSGSVTVNTPDRSFVMGVGQGMWIPADTLHQSLCRTDLMFQVVYIDPSLGGAHPSCKVFDVSTLMRGLVDEIIAMRYEFAMDARMSAIAALLLDEIERAPRLAERLLLPADPRLRRVCEAITAEPGDRHDIDYWAREAGMARRTFTRLFQVEMGMGFAAWRRRVRVVEAASRIAAGKSIAEVAFDLGYDNAGSFSTMFRRIFGVAPGTLK
ncbi:AraC family transcriptional regulator [Acetobacter vaccinii]|uniref:Helix-turn-helix domain-containing protein n=1 Tax=Acetobacter vaccinii TaxID=2592655 RepID=A0A5C1YMY3_9PROT|nr:helix-turn-helix transcriptional regulator [Acetobacter vaccinii]QEO17654.1 helix-turn-helix domain-containing protein [Acetobacter vaccinii]